MKFVQFVVKKLEVMNEVGISLDTVWMLLAAMLVFWMQPGFALCEAGFTQGKNTANILMKNFVDFMFGSLLLPSPSYRKHGCRSSPMRITRRNWLVSKFLGAYSKGASLT